MQLSTSTSALDSNLLPLLPATAGCAAPGTAGPGVFADFMPAPAPVFGEGAFVAPVQLPPVSVPGGLVCTLALTVPAPVEAELPATPFSSATAHAPGSGAVNFTPTPVPAADEPVTSDPATNEPRRPIPTPTAARPSRALSSPAPTVRSARALPRAETSPAEKIPAVVPLTLAPLPAALSTDLAITPPSDLTPNSPAPVLSDEVTDLNVAGEIPPRPPAARSPWLLPAARPANAAPAGAPANLSAAVVLPDVSTIAAVPAAPVQSALVQVGRNSSFNTRVASAVESRIGSETSPESRPTLTPFSPEPRSPALPFYSSPESAPHLPVPVVVALNPGAVNRPTEFSVTPAIANSVGVAPALPVEVSGETSVEVAAATPAENRSMPRLSSRAEKFAAMRSEISTSVNLPSGEEDKNFLKSVDEEVAEAPTSLGIDVAKSSATMSAAPSRHRSLAASSAESDVSLAAAPRDPPASTPSAAPSTTAEITAAAHRAVDAVLASTERLTSVTSSFINLKFSVGGADLDVRVEVRGGAVHATFRTDSPELRTALAQEWQSTNSLPADHSLRLAAPVFAAGDRSGAEAGAAFSGEQSSQARDQHARPSAEFVLPGTTRSRLGSSSPAGAAGVPALPARSAPATTLHLHAFA